MKGFKFPALTTLLVVLAGLGASMVGAKDAEFMPGTTFRDCDMHCPEMIVVPAGEFVMGSAEGIGSKQERPSHKVTIAQPFAVSRFEVTFEEWDACVTSGGCSHRPDDRGWGRGRRPVINVSWQDVQEYLTWISERTGMPYRLLSEAEWEYAARAKATTRYSFADDDAELGQHAWYVFNANGTTRPVGGKKPNAFGLFDMHGNVWEWVQDCYQNSYNGAPTDASAITSSDCESRVLRGGSWNALPDLLRSAYRFKYYADGRNYLFGFRVARTHRRSSTD